MIATKICTYFVLLILVRCAQMHCECGWRRNKLKKKSFPLKLNQLKIAPIKLPLESQAPGKSRLTDTYFLLSALQSYNNPSNLKDIWI